MFKSEITYLIKICNMFTVFLFTLSTFANQGLISWTPYVFIYVQQLIQTANMPIPNESVFD